MLALTPFTFTAGLIRASGDLWSRNLRFAQVFVDAALHQQMVFAGWESPKPVAAAKAAQKPQSRARKKPSAPKPMPKRKSGPDTNDMPV